MVIYKILQQVYVEINANAIIDYFEWFVGLQYYSMRAYNMLIKYGSCSTKFPTPRFTNLWCKMSSFSLQEGYIPITIYCVS